MSAKLIAMTDFMPKSLNAHTACSLDEPHPKFSPLIIIWAFSKSFLLRIKSSFFFLFDISTSRSPGSLYLQSSKRKFPKPCLETAFKYCLGIIASVSILFLISGIAIDLKVLNLLAFLWVNLIKIKREKIKKFSLSP